MIAWVTAFILKSWELPTYLKTSERIKAEEISASTGEKSRD